MRLNFSIEYYCEHCNQYWLADNNKPYHIVCHHCPRCLCMMKTKLIDRLKIIFITWFCKDN